MTTAAPQIRHARTRRSVIPVLATGISPSRAQRTARRLQHPRAVIH